MRKIGLLFVLFMLFNVSLNAAVPAEERTALIAFYNATAGDNWGDNSGWKNPPLDTDGFAVPGTENTWFGITVAGDHVTEIDFGIFGNNLSGPLPAELGNLAYLETLFLLRDNLIGSIPPELGNLTHLITLDLYMNQLAGPIPPGLGNLTNLEELSLGENQLTGTIPPELGNLSKLKFLFLSYNQLTGSIPPELGNLANLEHLSLWDIGLTGTIPPELGNLTRLRNLGMSYNQLTGSIPTELGNLVNLEDVYLTGNQLTGSIPPGFGNLVNLENLSLHSNQLSGTLPPELGNLSNLDSLHLENNQLSGSIPAEYGNLSNLRVFFIYSNKLSGDIPSTLLNLSNLSKFVDIRYNALYTDNEALWSLLKGDYPDWRDTQTIAPSNVSAAPVTSSSITVSWTPITFTSYTGGYKVYYSLTTGGPWTYGGMTTRKSTSSYTVTGLTPGTTYYFVVATQTDPHTYNSNTVVSEYSEEVSAATHPVGGGYVIVLNRTALNFGCTAGGSAPASQFLYINSSGSSLNWAASVDAAWLGINPSSGTGPGLVTVSVDPSQVSEGTYTGTISVSDSNAINSPQTVSVSLAVYKAGASSEPFGSFATPLNNSTVRSSVPVTGWVLDDMGVESVKIYRMGSGNFIYIGDAVFVEGARPDVEAAFPSYPMNYRAGWGYMMLSNFLPNGGNGTFELLAIASDVEGNQVILGSKTITCDNANAVKPFGAIDTPAQGGTAAGSDFRNHGWALTPLPNAIPLDGSTIKVYIDGVHVGYPVYNIYRSDVAALFPGYINSDGAHAYFDFDTTAYTNGVHTIQWAVSDDAGNADGIGSRYFAVQNSQGRGRRAQGMGFKNKGSELQAFSEIPVDGFEPVGVVKGYRKFLDPRYMYPDNEGIITVDIKESERLEIHFDKHLTPVMPLPVGSTLDAEGGIFYWQAGAGFLGEYRFVFLVKGSDGDRRKYIRVVIGPKFE